jgi:hypothetical protein
MAFENFPSAGDQPPVFPPPEKKDRRNIITILLVIALLASWGYIIWDKGQTKETILQKDIQYAAVVTEKDTLQSLLDEATMRYDLLKTSNAKKDSAISL